jgi:hypothetical protein
MLMVFALEEQFRLQLLIKYRRANYGSSQYERSNDGRRAMDVGDVDRVGPGSR